MKAVFSRVATTVATAGIVLSAGLGTASADPSANPHSFEVPAVCDNGVSYEFLVAGNGEFTPAHDKESNTLLVVTGFGEAHGVLTDDEGNVLDEFTDPAVSKGNATKGRKTSVTCAFSFEESFTDPDLGLLHFSFEGTAVGFLTPAR